MNSLSKLAIMLAATAGGPASATTASPDAVGAWLHERAMRAAHHDQAGDRERGRLPGSYRVIALGALDAPDSVKQQLRAEIAAGREGGRQAHGGIPSTSRLMASLPRRQPSGSVLRRSLPGPPSNLQPTSLGAARLIGMEPSGVLDGSRSSGLTRFYHVPEVGIVSFSEDNFLAAGRHIEVIAEAQNTEVNGALARMEQQTDQRGASRVALSWSRYDKTYELVAITDAGVDTDRVVRILKEVAAAVMD